MPLSHHVMCHVLERWQHLREGLAQRSLRLLQSVKVICFETWGSKPCFLSLANGRLQQDVVLGKTLGEDHQRPKSYSLQGNIGCCSLGNFSITAKVCGYISSAIAPVHQHVPVP